MDRSKRPGLKSIHWPVRPALGLALLFGSIAQLQAGPTTAQPQLPLELRSQGEAVKLREEAAEICVRAEKLVSAEVERYEAKKVGVKNLMGIGKAHVAVRQLARVAERLQDWGEPAGHELSLRANELSTRLEGLISAARIDFQPALTSAQPKFYANVENKKRVKIDVEKLRRAKKLQLAEQKFLATYDELLAMGVYYNLLSNRGPLTAWDTLSESLLPQARAERREQILAAMNEEQKQVQPDFAALTKQLDAAATSLSATGKAEFAGKKLSGPDWLAKFSASWRQAEHAALRAQAIAWAIAGDAVQNSNTKPAISDTNFTAALVRLVEADGARVQAADAKGLYAKYVRAAAPLVSVAANHDLKDQLEQSLNKLAGKSPEFAADVAGYRAATHDLLRWRVRAAESQARRLKKDFPSLATAVPKDFRLRASAPALLTEVSPPLLNKKFAASDLIATDGNATSRAVDRVYATAKSPVEPKNFELLERELLVSESAEPLTLEAAVALLKCRRGDVVELGGSVTQLELLAWIPLLADAEANGPGMFRPGDGAGDGGTSNKSAVPPLRELRLRVEIKPNWLRQSYFFVDVAD